MSDSTNTETQTDTGAEPDDFQIAATAITRAIRAINNNQRGGDGAGFITHLLAAVAANLGSSDAVTAGRPGSWEAAGVTDLLRSTVGYDDEYLLTYRTEPVEVVVNSVYELDDLGMFETYEASTNHIGQTLFGDRWTPSRDRLTLDQLEKIEDIEEPLAELEHRDRAEYRQRFTATVQARFEQMRTEDPHRYPEHMTVTVRFADEDLSYPASNDDLTDLWGSDLASLLYQHAREHTPLPGSNTQPDWTAGQSHAKALLDAGHWPHLRIPQHAHYGTPTTTKEN
ncbi:hypothetical protein ACIBL3_00210 [Kribbella sp. NPDC050124]|uniref:hypothetical protein n=1 Tax=Kribbella sp. NPDC050124 TaxID=3364114 RepID=UPI00378B2D86